MKEDFETIKAQLPGILKIASDFCGRPKKRGTCYFIKSPISHDKTWSLALYPASNTYCDFAGGNRGGDSISLMAHLKGVDNWTALKILKDFYGLSDAREQDKQETRRRILEQQEREQRKQDFKTALSARIDDLRRWENIYRLALKNRLYEPFTDEWAHCVNELHKTSYQLDILCASDCDSYRFMKTSSGSMPSDYWQWLIDALSILAECGVFQATAQELKEIRAQRDYELTRKPGGGRRCSIEW